MKRNMLGLLIALVMVLGMAVACGPTEPEVIEKVVTQEVEKVVTQIVQETVKETVIVEGTPKVIEKEVTKEVEKVVTATPETGTKLAEEQVVRVLMRGKKSAISPNQEGGLGRNWDRVVWLSPMQLQADGSVTPSLAESVDISEDGTEFTLHLDPEAVFSNGNPITAEAVKEAWEWGARVENLPSWGGSYNILRFVAGMEAVNAGESDDAAGLEVVDDTTLKIILDKPVHKFDEMLASYMLGVFDASDDVGNFDYWRKPAVSGPFLIEWDPDTGAVDLTPNPNWWGEKPTLERVEMRVVEDAQTRLIAYENEEADLLKDTGTLVEQLLESHPDELVPMPSMGFFYLGVNNQLEPTDDPHLNLALLLAIDRNNVITSLFPARKVVDTILQEGMNCYNPDLTIPYDPEMAKEELAKSKYGSAENVPPIKLQYWADIDFWGRILTGFQQQWRDNLGLEVELYGVDEYDVPNFNIGRNSGGAGVNDPSDILSKYALSDGTYAEYQGYMPTQELNDLAIEADAMPDAEMAARCEIYSEIERKLILEEAAVWPMIGVPYSWVVKPYIQGLETNFSQEINWDEIVVLEH